MARLTYDEAKDIAQRFNIDLTQNFHALNSEAVERVLAAAKERKFRKTHLANGSKGRYFFYYLKRTVDRGS